MKRIWIIIVFAAILGFVIGMYAFNNKKQSIAVEEIEDDCTKIASLIENKNDELQVNSINKKISPNCKLLFKIYYNKCDHLIQKKENIKDEEVNLTEEEFRKKFKDWEVQKFTTNEIILYKELNEFCDEHYMLKEKDGFIAVYKLNENNDLNLAELTDIAVEYLEHKDLEQIKNGILLYTKEELNKTLEDFE